MPLGGLRVVVRAAEPDAHLQRASVAVGTASCGAAVRAEGRARRLSGPAARHVSNATRHPQG